MPDDEATPGGGHRLLPLAVGVGPSSKLGLDMVTGTSDGGCRLAPATHVQSHLGVVRPLGHSTLITSPSLS